MNKPVIPPEGPWNDPECLDSINPRVKKWIACAAKDLCDTLTQRSDCPAQFMASWSNAIHSLEEAQEVLVETWPKK